MNKDCCTVLKHALSRQCLTDNQFMHFLKGLPTVLALPESDGAQEKTRTSTTLRSLTPEASASTNSATWAFTVAVGSGWIKRSEAEVKSCQADATKFSTFRAFNLAFRRGKMRHILNLT